MRNGRIYYTSYFSYYSGLQITIGSVDTASHIDFEELFIPEADEIIKDLFFANDSIAYAITYDGRIYRNEHIPGIYTPVLENEYNAETIIYPNPTGDYIQIHHDAYNSACIFTVFDQTGKLLMSKNIVDEKIIVNDLEEGIYFFKLSNTDNIITTGKFIKQ